MVLNSSNLILLKDPRDREVIVGVLNSALFRVLMNLLNPTINNTPGDVHRLPWPVLLPEARERIEHAVRTIRASIEIQRAKETDSQTYQIGPGRGRCLSQIVRDEIGELWQSQMRMIQAKAAIEKTVADSLLSNQADLEFIFEWYGVAPCHVISGSVALGRSITVDTLHADCHLERLAIELETAPDKMCVESYVKEVSSDVTARTVGNIVESVALYLIGRLRLKQERNSREVPDWVDTDGVIPLTPIATESTLCDRAQKLLQASDIDTSDFANLMGEPLDTWLATGFFKHHIRQFKRRPIAWQLQSGSYTPRSAPAFACVAYYHKIDADALPKIRSQYVGPLRQRMETEQRGIESIASDARTDRQEQRRVELDDAIAELHNFNSALDAVITSGFGPKPLISKLRQYAIDDGMLSLKSRWLRRLCDLIEKTSLTNWLNAADRSGLHPELANWIQDAMTHLNHHCARVGPKPPDQKNLATDDPNARDLAALISPHGESMMENSLKMACVVWWKPFEDGVLGPLKKQVKQLKAEQKECQAALKAEPGPSPPAARRLKARVKEIKAEVKELNSEIAEKTAPARAIREQIEDWRSDEPRTWGDWLAEQPLFDQISSLDDRRIPPTTIAEFIAQESLYAPDINDGVRVNIAPLQKAGLLAADVLATKDVDKAIADRAEWRSDERRWVREGKLPECGWWPDREGRSHDE